MLCYFCQDRSLDAAKSLEIEGKPPSSANTVFATSRPIKHVILSRLPPGALGGHCVGTLDAWRWIRVRWADCATLHRLASLQTAHVISLDAVWTIRVLIFVIATSLPGRVYSICGRILLVSILGYSTWTLISVVRAIAIRRATRIAHHVVKIARWCRLALRRRIARVPLGLACSGRSRRGASRTVLMRRTSNFWGQMCMIGMHGSSRAVGVVSVRHSVAIVWST
jgi:hypothetical protein